MILVEGLGEKYDQIKWEDRPDTPPTISRAGRKKSSASCPFNIITDDFSPRYEGKIEAQSGIRLTSKSEFRRKLKEKGLIQL